MIYFLSLIQRSIDVLRIDYIDGNVDDEWSDLSELIKKGELSDVRQLVLSLTSANGIPKETIVQHLNILRQGNLLAPFIKFVNIIF